MFTGKWKGERNERHVYHKQPPQQVFGEAKQYPGLSALFSKPPLSKTALLIFYHAYLLPPPLFFLPFSLLREYGRSG